MAQVTEREEFRQGLVSGRAQGCGSCATHVTATGRDKGMHSHMAGLDGETVPEPRFRSQQY